ncbi:MAG: hypothetical protein V4450_07265 [Bacteroidota bacterium]
MQFFKKKRTIYREKNRALLHRWNLFECRFFSIKIHKLMSSDSACDHDHPWAFITFLLKGGYVEYTPTGSKVYSRFSLLYRPAKYVHRLEIHQPVWTFVITFKKVRQWGFITPRGWIPFYEYKGGDRCE